MGADRNWYALPDLVLKLRPNRDPPGDTTQRDPARQRGKLGKRHTARTHHQAAVRAWGSAPCRLCAWALHAKRCEELGGGVRRSHLRAPRRRSPARLKLVCYANSAPPHNTRRVASAETKSRGRIPMGRADGDREGKRRAIGHPGGTANHIRLWGAKKRVSATSKPRLMDLALPGVTVLSEAHPPLSASLWHRGRSCHQVRGTRGRLCFSDMRVAG